MEKNKSQKTSALQHVFRRKSGETLGLVDAFVYA